MGVKISVPEQMLAYVMERASENSQMERQVEMEWLSISMGIPFQMSSHMLGMTSEMSSPDIA
jgi:hypothetical protein